ncbi:MAG: hypothetical protein LBS60_09380 [Deltaproteobacteria bacterium]|jgi:hypothetical protein|nr:hypothetical protein [Deltaproteobacteria bacterium]
MTQGYWRQGKTGWSWHERPDQDSWPEEGYPFAEAKAALLRDLEQVREHYRYMGHDSIAHGYVLMEMIVHPSRQKAVNFPSTFIKTLKLTPVEVQQGHIVPRIDRDLGEDLLTTTATVITKKILVATQKKSLKKIMALLEAIAPNTREAAEMACLEKIRPYSPLSTGRLSPPSSDGPAEGDEKFEVDLFRVPRSSKHPILSFRAMSRDLGFTVDTHKSLGRDTAFPGMAKTSLLTLKLSGPRAVASKLLNYSLLASIRRVTD